MLFSLVLLSNTSCNDDDGGCQGLDCLPPATQTGAGTFGCLVNGQPYVDNSGDFNCFYQLVDGEYFFGIGSDNEQARLSQIIIASNNKQIIVDTPIALNENANMQFYAEINLENTSGDFTTANLQDGTITFIEFTIQIPDTGEIIEVSEGRFDSFFTQ